MAEIEAENTPSKRMAEETEAETTPDLHIFDLNDDCLINVLSFLKFEEISILFEVHSRFHAAIAANSIDLQIEIRSDNLRQMGHFLRTFGRKVRKIKLSWIFEGWHKSQALELITKYCNAGNVEQFQCDFDCNNEVDERFLQNNLTFFRGLKSLKFRNIDLENELQVRMLTKMVRIEHLDLGNVSTSCLCSHVLTKPQLKSLRLVYHEWDTPVEFENWPRLDSLKTLDITLSLKDLPVLRCFSKLVDLTLNIIDSGHYYLLNSLEVPATLKRLRLEMRNFPTSLLVQLANQTILEHLALNLSGAIGQAEEEHYLVDIIAALSRFTKLKSLHLRTKWQFKFRLLNLMKSLPELRCLVIQGDELKSVDLLELEHFVCRIVSSARNLNRIDLKPDFAILSTTNDYYYHRFYKNVSLIRSKQDNKAVLKMRIRDYRYKLYIEKNKSAILEVVH